MWIFKNKKSGTLSQNEMDSALATQKSLEFNFSVINKRHVEIKYATNSKPCGISKSCTY